MLGKLLKYEVKATARTFLPFYIALIAMALVNKLFSLINSKQDIYLVMEYYGDNPVPANLIQIPAAIAMTAFVGVIVAVFVVTVFVMIQRFYKNLLGDEGYLMFTLPVKPWQNILSKLAVSTMWLVVSTIVTAISIFIVAATSEFFEYLPQLLLEYSQTFAQESGMSLGFLVTEVIVLGIISLVVSVLQVYVSIALGQLFNTHKLLAAFGAYFVINVAIQVISSIAMLIFAAQVNTDAYASIVPILQSTMVLGAFINIACGVAFYIGTNWLLSKKLNLE